MTRRPDRSVPLAAHALTALVALVALIAPAAPARAQEEPPPEPPPAAAAAGDPPRWRMIDGSAPFFDPDRDPPLSWWMGVHIDTDEAPYVNERHLEAALARFDVFCEHAAKRGYNTIWLGNLIHCAVLDGVTDLGLPPVYGPQSPFRMRHERYRATMKRAVEIAKRHGCEVVIDTDFPAWTSELLYWLGDGGASIDNPRLWVAYETAITELFDEVGAAAVSIRIGEGGGAYDTSGYASTIGVRTVEQTQRAIRGLLEIVEKYNATKNAEKKVFKKKTDKKLFFRTWTIGIGEIGALHTNKEKYEEVFRPFYGNDTLVAVIKHVAMDFFQHVPINETIGVGEVAQIVEFQARREYECFGSFPNYRAEPFKQTITAFRENDNFAGISVWPTIGGFLFRSPTYYRCQGPDDWIDLNVHAYGRLVADPTLAPAALVREWAAEKALSPADAAVLTEILLASDDVVGKGLYIRPYAEKRVAMFGLDYMPSMLWLYWTRPVAAYGVQALIYHHAQGEVDRAIAEGEEALASVDRLVAKAETMSETAFRARLLAALQWQRSVFRVMGSYRRVFLEHHRWAHRAEGASYDAWRASLPELQAAVEEHETTWADDRFLPPLDLRELHRLLRDDALIPTLRPVAGGLAALQVLLAFSLMMMLRPRASGFFGRLAGNGASGPLGLLLVAGALAGSAVVVLCGYGAANVAALVGGATLVAWLLMFIVLRVLRPEATEDGLETRLADEARLALAGLVPALLLSAFAMGLFAFRGPVLVHWLAIGALIGPTRGVLAALGLGTAALFIVAVDRSAAPARGLRGWLATPLCGLVLIAAAGGAVAAVGKAAIVPLNDHLRLAPTVLGEAGTGVDELVD